MFAALATILSGLSLMNQASNNKKSSTSGYAPEWPPVKEAMELKKNNPKEFARKMKERQEVYNIGVPWEKL